MPMNKKTFTLAVLFLVATIVWLAANVYWDLTGHLSIFSTVVAVLFVVFAAMMVYNECQKKKCKHLEEVNRHKIP